MKVLFLVIKELYNISVFQVKTSPVPQNRCIFSGTYSAWQVTCSTPWDLFPKYFMDPSTCSPLLLSPWFMLSVFLSPQSWSSFSHAFTLPIYCPKWVSLYVITCQSLTDFFMVIQRVKDIAGRKTNFSIRFLKENTTSLKADITMITCSPQQHAVP